MPHFGLMDERKLGPIQGPFMRARLHLRSGKRRLRQSKTAAGIVTLYDALQGAMEYYVAAQEGSARFQVKKGEDLDNAGTLYAVLVRSGVLDDRTFDFESFDRLTDRALQEEITGYDYRELVSGIERVMTLLGVMPFDEAQLPPEDPNTF